MLNFRRTVIIITTISTVENKRGILQSAITGIFSFFNITGPCVLFQALNIEGRFKVVIASLPTKSTDELLFINYFTTDNILLCLHENQVEFRLQL